MCIVCELGRSPNREEIKGNTLNISGCEKVIEIQVPEGLQELYCYDCINLTSLGPLPKSLWILNCGNTNLTSLEPLPEGLQKLFCSCCTSLTNLGPLPESLRLLSCVDCTSLTSLRLSEGLQELFCIGCTNLTSLGPLPESLHTLYCSDCTNLTSLGPLSEGLQTLWCNGCINLTSLGPLPEGLEYLNCDGCRVLTRVGPQSAIDNLDDYQPSTWIPSEELEENLKKLVLVQRFCRSLRTRKLLRLSRTRKFCEFFYHPENYGGRWAKASLRKMMMTKEDR